jgi:endonuclease/exonuclease/phosphatase family metal-dependent hydrolase
MTREPALLSECRALAAELLRYPTLAGLRGAPEWPAMQRRLDAVLGTVRRHEPVRAPAAPADPARVRAVSWNLEHGNQYEAIERALTGNAQLSGADVLILVETDLGMARAHNRDVAADLAAALGFHAVWAPLFLETGVGRHDDALSAAGRSNQEALFGMAILSRWPIGDIRIVPLPSPERYQFDVERMYGRFIALVAEIRRPGAPFVTVAVHLEVHRTRRHREIQMRTVLEALRGETRPIILGGDFNTTTFDRGRLWAPYSGAMVLAATPGALLRRRLLRPDRGHARERLFRALREAGFEWRPLSDRRPTLRLRFARVPEAAGPFAWGITQPLMRWMETRAHLRLDWFAARGWRGCRGTTVRGLDGPGAASDHAPILGEFW